MSAYAPYRRSSLAYTGVGATWMPPHGKSIGTDRLTVGQQLTTGQSIVSKTGEFELVLQTDGNLVVYNLDPAARDKDLWNAGTYTSCRGARAVFQTDGNLVVYNTQNAPCWASQTNGKGAATLLMQDDGNLVIYANDGRPLWNTGTTGGHRPPKTNPLAIVGTLVNKVESIPVLGPVVHVFDEAAAAPFNIATSIASGERLDHVAVDAFKAQLKIVKDVAPYAATVVSFIPGIGTGVAAAIGAGVALAEGRSITEAAKSAIRSALPGGAIAATGFDLAMKVASGENVAKAALESSRNLLPDENSRKAFDIGLAVVTGQKIQTALTNGLMSIAPGQLKEVLSAGEKALASTPGLSTALAALTPSAATKEGFQFAAGLLSHTGLNEKALVAARSQLPADVRAGFDAAMKTQVPHIAWLANVVSAPVTPVAKPPVPTMPATTPVATAPKPPTMPGFVKPASPPAVVVAPKPATPVMPGFQKPQVAAMKPGTYAPYPSGMRGTLSGPPSLGAPGHGGGHGGGGGHGHGPHRQGGHPYIFRGGRRSPGWWWDVPWSPTTVTTTETCSTWGDTLDMPPQMQTAARVALNVSQGRPTTVRGPDNVLYLFSLENGTMTARACATGG